MLGARIFYIFTIVDHGLKYYICVTKKVLINASFLNICGYKKINRLCHQLIPVKVKIKKIMNNLLGFNVDYTDTYAEYTTNMVLNLIIKVIIGKQKPAFTVMRIVFCGVVIWNWITGLGWVGQVRIRRFLQ